MKTLLSWAPLLLGAGVVIQAGLNRQIAAQWGLATATVLNATILVTGALTVFVVAVKWPQLLPAEIAVKAKDGNFAGAVHWWFILPGLIGLMLVLGGPWCIARWGAVHTFILVVSAQLFSSLLWDWKVEQLPVTKERVAGVILTWVGVLIATRGQ